MIHVDVVLLKSVTMCIPDATKQLPLPIVNQVLSRNDGMACE